MFVRERSVSIMSLLLILNHSQEHCSYQCDVSNQKNVFRFFLSSSRVVRLQKKTKKRKVFSFSLKAFSHSATDQYLDAKFDRSHETVAVIIGKRALLPCYVSLPESKNRGIASFKVMIIFI